MGEFEGRLQWQFVNCLWQQAIGHYFICCNQHIKWSPESRKKPDDLHKLTQVLVQ